jgi:hypothetical protein
MNLQEVTRCNLLEEIMTFPVEKCSHYTNRNQPNIDDMYKIAWVVETRNRGPVGFTEGYTREIKIRPPDPNENMPTQSPVIGGRKEADR